MEYYLIGSLRNENLGTIGNELRQAGLEIFDSWYAAGPIADDCWRDYEKAKGSNYKQALAGYAAQHIFQFDRKHLDRCDGAILAYPAGKSAHLELGYILGQGKPGYILLDGEPERFDVMLNFATAVCYTTTELIGVIREGYWSQFQHRNKNRQNLVPFYPLESEHEVPSVTGGRYVI